MEFCLMKREIDRKCLNNALVHANAQSFDRCECLHRVLRARAPMMRALVMCAR